MDNASKALIIAGAILIAVMLVSLGVMLFNQGANTAEQAGRLMDSTAIATYNSTYLMYEGKGRTASEAKSLINRVKAHNANQQEVYDYGTIDGTASTRKTSEISTKKLYDIECTAFQNNGAVKTINITDSSSTPTNYGT